jgi:predicted phosphoribosyltransferase
VPVGLEVARALQLPLDVFIVRKLGLPWQPEVAMGAIASGGVQVLNEDMVAGWRITPEEIAEVAAREGAELHRREVSYRRGRAPADVFGHEVLLVDDGVATGASLRAAVVAVKRLGATRVVVAVPVGARDSCAELAHEVGELVCPLQPDDFTAVGQWYEDFSVTTDADVRRCLDEAAALPVAVSTAERHDFLSE